MSTMSSELTPAEVRCHTNTSHFSAAFVEGVDTDGVGGGGSNAGGLVMSWVQTRGRLEQGSGDAGKDLVLLRGGGFPQVLLAGGVGPGGAVFSPSGAHFAVHAAGALLLGATGDGAGRLRRWVVLGAGEGFVGAPAWIGEDRVLFGVRGGGAPARERLFVTAVRPTGAAEGETEAGARQGPLFVAERGGALLSWDWDHSRTAADAAGSTESGVGFRVAVVHRLADAMLAEVAVVDICAGKGEGGAPSLFPRRSDVVALDCRQEYCRPQAAFLSTGALLLRLNALLLPDGDDQLGRCCVRDAKALRALSPEEVRAGEVRHGLWVLAEGSGPPARLEPVDVMPYAVHGAYDCCSGSYGSPGAAEGFQMDRARERVVVTARRTGPSSAIAYSDDLFELRLTEEGTDGERRLVQVGGIGTEAQSGRGCKIPVAVGGGDNSSIVYHHRSPTESGDLWTSPSGAAGATQSSSPDARLTATMPLSLRRKLLTPVEVTVPNLRADCATAEAPPLTVHTQIFAPDDGGDGPLQPLLWLHGGPMCHYSYDCNPLLTYLARCGYLVMAPNFSGSTGNGPAFMDRVLGAGCGVADLSDCLACAEYLASAAARTLEPRLDLSRGVAVGGHSWGGYLALRCLLHTDGRDESAFGCGVAAAAIADWSVQQRHTEVRYYDRALLGGWVYEQEVAERARAASPASAATELRAPVLVLHGDKDVDVPFRQIPPLVEALGRSPHPGASVESHFYAGEGHGIAGTEAQADYLDRIRTFLRIHMKPWDFTDNPHGEVTAY